MRARWTGIKVCRSCLGTKGGKNCEMCCETATILCDECGEVYPHAAAEYHTPAGEFCRRCFQHMKDEAA